MFCAVVFFDVPVARQVFGFLFLTFVPGAIIIYTLEMKGLSKLEKLLVSVGASIAFLMFTGFLLNELSGAAGFYRPLQLLPLTGVLLAFAIFGCVVIRSKKVYAGFWHFEDLRHNLYLVLLLVLPLLSIIGAFLVNAHGSNILLLFELILIPSLFGILVISKKARSTKLYVVTVFAIAVALVYHTSLISNYVFQYGSDGLSEYAVFRFTATNQHWSIANPGEYGRYYSMLSITILPTFYSSVLNIDPTLLFKMISPLILAFIPLCLYQIWQKYVGMKYAFVAAFLFMAQQTFYTEMLGLNKQIVAELFFALLLIAILNGEIKPLSKMVLFTVFGFGLIVSHYGISIIFLSFASVTFAYSYITKRTSKVSAFMIASFSVVMFSWYIYTSRSATFESILQFGNYILAGLGDFLNPAARGGTVLLGLGVGSAPTVWNTLGRAFAYATEILIVLGLVGLITKRLKSRFDNDYMTFTAMAIALLMALIIVPVLANTLNMTRFYHILLFFLAPLCVLGAEFLGNLFSKHKELLISVLLLIILVPYFLFQTNFIYEVTKSDSYSVSLSGYRMDPSRLYGQFQYIDAYNVFGVEWISRNTNPELVQVYADASSGYAVLMSYGMLNRSRLTVLSNVTTTISEGIVYLNTLNVVYGIVFRSSDPSFNVTEIYPILDNLSTIYSNGNCVVFENTGQ
jgi:uncharacterized membrane protein